jgi:hypothetical protein
MNITAFLSNCVQYNIPISFSKYGDGEYNCVAGIDSHNCDKDKYTEKLKTSLTNSFLYMVNETDNSFIGLWQNEISQDFWETLSGKKIKWVDYHSIIIRQNDLLVNRDILKSKIDLFKNIKVSPLKKIIICNKLLLKAAILFNTDHTIQIPFNNWFDEHIETVIESVSNIIGTDSNHIVITCCGMGAKVIISELKKRFPKGIYLDFGSALDIICTKKDSRGFYYTYDDIKRELINILPENWEDEQFNPIYEEAKDKLGVHLKQQEYLKIAKHISFYLSDSTLHRIAYLNKIIDEVNSYPYIVDLFIHVNNDYSLDKLLTINERTNGSTKIVCHDLTDTHPFYLTWKCREMLKEQRNYYDIFMYIEDDIFVPAKAIEYWLAYKDLVIKSGNNLGFLRVETDSENREFSVDLSEKMIAKVDINDIPFAINSINPYCGFWIYDKKEFNRFINSHYYNIANIEGYNIREKSAVGLHGMRSHWYKYSIIPIINKRVVDACKIYHLTNNYCNANSVLINDIIE